jgi:hypothetical protein
LLLKGRKIADAEENLQTKIITADELFEFL